MTSSIGTVGPGDAEIPKLQRVWQHRWQRRERMLGVVEQGGLTPAQRTLRARMAAYTLHATHDARETTKPARDAFMARFERQVDPEGRLPQAERRRRAEAAKKAYFTGLAMKSARARQRRNRTGGS